MYIHVVHTHGRSHTLLECMLSVCVCVRVCAVARIPFMCYVRPQQVKSVCVCVCVCLCVCVCVSYNVCIIHVSCVGLARQSQGKFPLL